MSVQSIDMYIYVHIWKRKKKYIYIYIWYDVYIIYIHISTTQYSFPLYELTLASQPLQCDTLARQPQHSRSNRKPRRSRHCTRVWRSTPGWLLAIDQMTRRKAYAQQDIQQNQETNFLWTATQKRKRKRPIPAHPNPRPSHFQIFSAQRRGCTWQRRSLGDSDAL